MRMNKKILLSMLMVIISTLFSFAMSDDYDPNYKLQHRNVFVMSADSTQGYASLSNISTAVGDSLELYAKPNYGFTFDRWESVKGLSTDTVSDNDTILAYFKELPKYNLTFISDDTTKGIVYGGNGLWYEGKIMEKDWLFYPHDPALIFESKNGYHFSYWETNMGNLKDIWDYYLTADDTITLHFEKDTVPMGYLDLRIERIDTLDLYGNLLFWDSYQTSEIKDSATVTNLTTKETFCSDIVSLSNYVFAYGDTLLVSVKSNDDFKNDSVYTVVYDDSSRHYIYKVIELTRPMQIVKLDEAEGDSFNVDITIATINNYYPDYKWEGNGRYAKGDTINVCIEKPLYYEMGSVLYRVPNDSCFSFVVKNDINIVLLQDYPIGVDQVAAEKESDPFVNVYTINGYLLKQHVKESEALDGLNKGLYIVGRKKVFVRR
jgi:hypothetical protein